ncbi:bifunctional 3-oxoadipate enol-lactonase/4-carboxymuconolactone decarboxylase PcaDC [Mycobacterium persicum]|uniref:3-oxoadipate enol-lactonase 2 n=1 Tax=Mycobacterium persicum TaxID=1487726 RepID=A0AB38UTW3_9MYCO|nr:4-carboxymuconolactone decarboxylase [Mycobacterium persicum]KZS84459.1 3-oxoadipate enol-lactonase [Mycobacterium persicum]ORB52662.1 4-carboxymuconolactone decarboxylase [Mycobacterium persicum]ORB88142.1 4-carboxymuconolactone decarboxylase [Mycobacterium persicum]ORB93420.1 4-carboxymuconolactone decarboxylase [Mycobacterium persicum]ORC00178.1 4-carboxymuconolactone decarboxylase [Mycobacterium persicum]
MPVPRLIATDFGGPHDAGVLLLGPSLGTSANTLWAAAAQRLADYVRVVGWDLPGHGNSPAATSPFTIAELANGVLTLADEIADAGTFHYAGVSIGGAVGLQLLLDAAHRLTSATLLCTGATIGTPEDWKTRAARVREEGISALSECAPKRWCSARFVERRPAVVARLLDVLGVTDAESYALACEALADFDVTGRLSHISTPVLAVAGGEDCVTPPECLRPLVSGVNDGRVVVLDEVGHLAPVEAPEQVADLILSRIDTRDNAYQAGIAVRREVLGNAHVDRIMAEKTAFTADFEDMITRYAWGSVWTRPGLDRRSRSMITLSALVACGHPDYLPMHLRAARRNGLTNDEIKELLLHLAIYVGVPEVNYAFRIANEVLADYDAAEATR